MLIRYGVERARGGGGGMYIGSDWEGREELMVVLLPWYKLVAVKYTIAPRQTHE